MKTKHSEVFSCTVKQSTINGQSIIMRLLVVLSVLLLVTLCQVQGGLYGAYVEGKFLKEYIDE